SAARRIRSRVGSLTPDWPRSARETVFADSPTSVATSCKVRRLRGAPSTIWTPSWIDCGLAGWCFAGSRGRARGPVERGDTGHAHDIDWARAGVLAGGQLFRAR